LLALPLLLGATAGLLVQALLGARRAFVRSRLGRPRRQQLLRFALTTLLHIVQPLARLAGRLSLGLSPWRFGRLTAELPRPIATSIWTPRWRGAEEWLRSLESALRGCGGYIRCGGEYDRWDFEVRGGLLGGARTLMAIEEHGAGQQLARFRAWPHLSLVGPLLTGLFALLAAHASLDGNGPVGAALGVLALVLAGRTVLECTAAVAAVRQALRTVQGEVATT
jgi:hypothetical protein